MINIPETICKRSILEIRNLNKYFGGIHAIKDISLSIEDGSIVGIAGDNGAGKSTLMKCIAGAYKQDSGKIIFNGAPLKSGSPQYARKMGIEMIYQNLWICPQLDVTSNIFLGKEICKSKFPIIDNQLMQKKSKDILEQLNSEISPDTIAGNLSGGQQQAVAIARAMISDAKLVIMDEPTAALGIRETHKTFELIKKMKTHGLTILIISHRLSDFLEICDRMVFMRQGQIYEDTPSKDLTESQLTAILTKS